MNRLMRKLKKYQNIIVINLIIFVSYIRIVSVPGLMGIDDVLANSYIFSPNNTIMDNIHNIIIRLVYWNPRIGEMMYFIVGCFPRWVFYLFYGIRVVLFFNLVYIYTYGKKSRDYLFSDKYIISILTSAVITLTLCPAYDEVFIWMAGTYNHLYDLIVILLVLLPFRLLLDDVNIFPKKKITKTIYLIVSFISGFTLEHIVPIQLLAEGLIIFFKNFRDKSSLKDKIRKNTLQISSMLLTSIAYIIFILSAKIRIDYFREANYLNETKYNLATRIITDYKYIIIPILVLLLIRKYTLKKIIKNVKFQMLSIILSILSMIILYFAPSYYELRTTFTLYFSLLTLLIYLINELFEKKFSRIFIYLNIIILGISIVGITVYFSGLNKFNVIREEQIIKVYKEYNVIVCPKYINDKPRNFFTLRLSNLENMECDNSYIKYLINKEKENPSFYQCELFP